jgi:hypothetical protein
VANVELVERGGVARRREQQLLVGHTRFLPDAATM